MKKTLTLGILSIGLCLISCGDSKRNKDIKMYSNTWDHIVNDGNLDLINNTNFTENITMISSPENIVGIENFKAYYQNFITGFSDIKFTVVHIFGEGENIVKHWNFKGTHTGEFFGIPATGKSVDIEGVTLAKMKDGKIAQEQDFMDNSVFMQQLGLAPNPENIGVIDKLYSHFSNGEIPSVMELMDNNIVWNESSCSSYSKDNPYEGPEAILNGVFGKIGEDNDYFKIENIELTGLGENKVLASLNYDGKIKKTGKEYKTGVVHLWTLNNGKITAFQQYIGQGEQ
ncbi:ester cyclase [Mariniflexile sp.]|uniref:ester cyclase n=1 Tax=Mariniflexile sp. TaxID=1979402 RepID=UPI0035696C65